MRIKKDLNLAELIKQYKPTGLFIKKNKVREETIKEVLYGIIASDIAGGPYEGKTLTEGLKENYRTVDLLDEKISHYFSDDSVMSIAIYTAAKNIQEQHITCDKMMEEYIRQMRKFAKLYPNAGYGMKFRQWALHDEENEEYQSFGDGSAMRSGVLGAMFEMVEDVIIHAALASYPTHAHPEGMKGGIVTAVLVWMALNGMSEKKMRDYILRHYPVITSEKKYFNQVHPGVTGKQLLEPHKYQTQSTDCMTAVPLAWIHFYETENYEDCLRCSLRYDCDTDTIMAISGAFAAAKYAPNNFIQGRMTSEIAEEYLDDFLWEHVK